MKKLKYKFTVLLVALLGACGAAKLSGQYNVDESGYAIKGYDPVAYFTLKAPTKGDPGISYKFNGVKYAFANEGHRDKFKANPDKYAPQYGGFCAFGVTQNAKYDIDPNAWAVVNDKLYLNLNQGAQRIWLKNRDENIVEADQIWPGLKNKN